VDETYVAERVPLLVIALKFMFKNEGDHVAQVLLELAWSDLLLAIQSNGT